LDLDAKMQNAIFSKTKQFRATGPVMGSLKRLYATSYRSSIDTVALHENAGPENAGLENDGLEFDGPEQRAVMSLVQEHAHTKDRSDFLMYRQTCFETVFFFTVGLQICSCSFFNGHFKFVFLFNLHYTNLQQGLKYLKMSTTYRKRR